MSFSFGFSGDDIEPDNDGPDQTTTSSLPTGAGNGDAHGTIPPKIHTLAELLEELPSQISYNNLSILGDTQSCTIARRSLFDIRTQLMAESSSTNDNDALIANLSSGDLCSGAYEGGFKTWECAIDLASYLINDSSYHSFARLDAGPMHVIELGAGSAMPSLAILSNIVRRNGDDPMSRAPVAFTLADYNSDVLKLCTAPNTFLSICLSPKSSGLPQSDEAESDFDLDLEPEDVQSAIANLTTTLSQQGISIRLISGGWGHEFVNLVTVAQNGASHPPKLLILASETIYSPSTLPMFTSTLLSLLRQGAAGSKALIAAKQIYFGVGGGVAEFERELKRQDGHTIMKTVWTTAGGNTVGRVILEVSLG